MKVTLRIEKNGSAIYEGAYDISDAQSFGRACADAWQKLRERRFKNATSIGALLDVLDEKMLDELDGARIHISRA